MDLVLAIDIRNTHTRLGLAADGALAAQWSLGTDAGCTADEAVAAVSTFFDAVACGLAPSKGEARRLVQQGGVSVNDEKVADVNAVLAQELFAGEGVIIKKGKKVFHRAALK